MADEAAEEMICPRVELLTEIETNIICSVDGCSKVLPNTSSLRMHLVKTHNIMTEVKENEMFERGSCQNKSKKKTYCCPVDGCIRGKSSGRVFSRLAHVKQHYMTIHGEKKFSCRVCGKTFGRNDACLRHEKACGKIFPCSCGCPFNSRTSMLTHAKRNGHAVPHPENINGTASTSVSSYNEGATCLPNYAEGTPLCFSILPVVNKGLAVFRPLRPKKLLLNAETQTEQPYFHTNNTRPLVQNVKSFGVGIALPRTEFTATCEYTQTMDEAYTQTMGGANTQAMDEAYTQTMGGANTQTMDEAYTQTMGGTNTQTMDEAYTQTMDEAYTQTMGGANTQTMDEAYTQTMDEGYTQTMDEAFTQTMDKAYTQTMDEAFTQTVDKAYTQTMDEAYTQTSFITDEQHFDIDFAIDNEEFKELTHSQTQTNWGLAFEEFPLFEDNQTQTLESYLEFDPSSITSDCGTQTKNILDDIFSVDTQTQTLLPLINFSEEQFERQCNSGRNHQTQALENIYLDSQT